MTADGLLMITCAGEAEFSLLCLLADSVMPRLEGATQEVNVFWLHGQHDRHYKKIPVVTGFHSFSVLFLLRIIRNSKFLVSFSFPNWFKALISRDFLKQQRAQGQNGTQAKSDFEPGRKHFYFCCKDRLFECSQHQVDTPGNAVFSIGLLFFFFFIKLEVSPW